MSSDHTPMWGVEGVRSALKRPGVAVLVLFVALVGLSLRNDPRGFLGTDTGSKVAALKALERHGGPVADLGYWAEELDPDGSLHPIYYAERHGQGWSDLTTATMVAAAQPLYEVGGYRLALLLPMTGAVAAAAAARVLARRMGARGHVAFWLVGLASPATVYALDLWEHAIGLGLMAWAAVAATTAVSSRSHGWVWGGVAGMLVGVAATMRTEAFLYGGVIVAVTCVTILIRRGLGHAVAVGLVACAGLAPPLLLGRWLEDRVIGGPVRGARTSGLAARVGAETAGRVDEALRTTFGLPGFRGSAGIILGVVLVALVVVAWSRARQPAADAQRSAVVAVCGTTLLYIVTFSQGLGFVPGLLTAAPVAVLGVFLLGKGTPSAPVGLDDASIDQIWTVRLVIVSALVALPLVWSTQFLGGAAPQWGARYALVSSLLLVVAGSVVLERTGPRAVIAGVAMSVLVTSAGLQWLTARSQSVSGFLQAIEEVSDDETVVVSRVAHVFREGAAFLDPDDRWLTAVGVTAELEALDVARRVDARRVVLVELGSSSPSEASDQRRLEAGWVATDRQVVEGLAEVPFTLVVYVDPSRVS